MTAAILEARPAPTLCVIEDNGIAVALGYLDGIHTFANEWAALHQAATLYQIAGLDLASFRIAAAACAARLCEADGKPASDALSKIGRAWDAAKRDLANGGSERELQHLEDLGRAHTHAVTVITGTRTAAMDLQHYRAILLVAMGANRTDDLRLGLYRMSETANISDSGIKASRKRLAALGLITQTGVAMTTVWALYIPPLDAPSGDLDFGFGFGADVFVRGKGPLRRTGKGLGPQAQRVLNVLSSERQSVSDIAETLGLSITAAKKALAGLELVWLAEPAGKIGRAPQWVIVTRAMTPEALTHAAEALNVEGVRDDRKIEHKALRAAWAAADGRPDKVRFF